MKLGCNRNTPLLTALLATSVAWVIPGCQSGTPRSSAPIVVKVAAFNDFHGNLNPPTTGTRVSAVPGSTDNMLELPTGGIEYLSTLIGELKARNPLHAVVAAGDLIGGSPLVASLFRHEPTIEVLGQIGLEFSSVGNHEFDAGRAELLRMQHGGCAEDRTANCRNGSFRGAQFQYLAANVIDQASGRPLFPPYAIKTFGTPGGGSLAIAFIGLVTRDTMNLVIPSGIAGLSFADEAVTANALVPELRARGIEAIAVLIHEGGRGHSDAFDDATCSDFNGPIVDIVTRFDPAIDLVVSGHTHRAYVCRIAGRLVTSAGAEGRFLTDIDLSIDPTTRDVVAASARQLAVVNDAAVNPLPERYPTIAKDARVSAQVQQYNERAAPLGQRRIGALTDTITRTVTAAGETPLGSLIADAQLEATRSAGAQIAFMNRGGMRTDLRGTDGYLTYSDVFAVHPFGNSLVTLTLTGAQIDALLEQQWTVTDTILQISAGFYYEWNASAPPGQRVDITRIRLDGQPLDPQRGYRVTVNDFLAQGGDGFTLFKQAADPLRGVMDVGALESYASAHAPLKAPPAGRIVRRE
jgi:5'-nucleotidase